ncbi:MAG: outer membrane protein assembly factor BamB family protein [Thermoleophilia bacterium]
MTSPCGCVGEARAGLPTKRWLFGHPEAAPAAASRNGRERMSRARRIERRRARKLGQIALLGLVAALPLAGACGPAPGSTTETGPPSTRATTTAVPDSQSAPWPVLGHDARRSGVSPYSGPDRPELLWQVAVGGPCWSSPAVARDGTIYVGGTGTELGEDGGLYAVRPDGRLAWVFRTTGDVLSSPAIAADGTVYVGSWNGFGDGRFYALSPDGTLRWQYDIGDTQSSPVIAADGTVYLCAADGRLLAFEPDGALSWQFETGGHAWQSSPALGADGTIYVGLQLVDDIYMVGTLFAVDRWGSEKWRFSLDAPMQDSHMNRPPAVSSDGTIYISRTDTGTLFAIDPDGSERWHFDVKGGGEIFPGVGEDGTVYVGSDSGTMYALRPDGSLLWDLDTSQAVLSAPAIDAEGTVYFASEGLVAIDPGGTLRYRYLQSDFGWSPPAIGADGTVYLVGNEGLAAVGDAR